MERDELELLRRVWFPVARLQDLRPGPVGATLLGQELVVYGGVDGPTVADGWCPHRGMKLSMGSMQAGELQCSYHGWRFASGSGRCTHVPSLPPHLPPTRVSLKTHPVYVAYGLVWSCLDEPCLPPLQIPELDVAPWEAVADPDLYQYRIGEWTYALGDPATVRCGIRALTENFRDMSHFAFVHARSMGSGVRREVDEYRVEKDGWRLRYTLSSHPDGVVLKDGDGGAGAARQGETFADVAYGRTNQYTLVLPSFSYIFSRLPAGGRRLVAQFVAPGPDPATSRLFWAVGIDDEVRERHHQTIRQAHDFDDQIFHEDFQIVENSWPREQPLDTRSQVHTRADAYSIAYRRRYRELLDQVRERYGSDGNSAFPMPATSSIDS